MCIFIRGKAEYTKEQEKSSISFAYTGHLYEASTGLYYAKARYYDADKGRFLSIDSYQGNIQNPNTLNPYIYACQNPYRYMDPSGHIAVATIAKLGTGALFDMGMQLTANYFFNSKTKGDFKASFNAINWWQVTVSAAQSLFTVKNAALTAAITGLGDVVVNWMKQGKKYSCGKALRDFAMGFLSDLATRYVCKYGKKAVAKGMEKMGVNSSKIKKLTGYNLAGEKKTTKTKKVYKKASIWERTLKRKVKTNELHANPLNEFSNPKIGPCNSAVSKYIKEINTTGKISEPIVVQKRSSGGYEIVNGHHRWLAAVKTNLKTVPIIIKNYRN